MSPAWAAALAGIVATAIAGVAWRQGRNANNSQETVDRAMAQARQEFATNTDASSSQRALLAGLAGLALAVLWLLWDRKR